MREFVDSNNMIFVALVGLQILDVATGVLCVHKREPFDTRKLTGGIAKKMGDWFFVAVSFLASHILVRLGGLLDMDFALSRTLGWLVVASLLFKECRSCFENVQCLGIFIPKPLQSILLLGEREFDGALKLPSENGSELSLQLNKSLDELSTADTVHIKVQK